MKTKASLRLFLALSGSAMLLVSQSQAAYYYWDTNGTTPGLGDTIGTWGTSAFQAVVTPSLGRGVIGGTIAPGATATGTADTMNFGTINLGLTGAATTIGTTGTININNITFGFGQADPVTLSAGGTITMAGTNPIIYVNNSSGTIGAVLAGAAGVSKAGPGTLNLTGANTYTGTTSVIGGGTLNVGNGTSGNLNTTTPTALTFNNGGGTFNVAQADTSSQGMGALAFTGGHGTITSTAASGAATQTLTFASLAARGLGATGNFNLATNTNAADNKIVLTDTSNAPLDSGSNNAGIFFGGSEYARYDSVNGYFRAVAYGTDTNALAALSGTDMGAVTSVSDVKLNGNITAQPTAAVNTIHLNGNTLTLLDADQVLDVNGILSNGGSITAAGKLQGTTGGGEIVFNVTGGNLSAASSIQDCRLTKTGAGTLTLSGANTYSGTTVINSGTLAVSGGSAIEDSAAVVLANKIGATLKLDASETIGNLSGGGYSGGTVDVQGNTLTFGDAGNQTFGGTFTGTTGGFIVKQGAGTLTLPNVNTFPGTFNINAGTVAFTLGNSGTTLLQTISSGGAISMAGGATISILPANQVALGQHTANNPSQLTVAGSGFVISNNINITSGTATFRVSGNGQRPLYTGNVTGGTSGSQTLSILQGTPGGGGGDAQAIMFSGVIQDGSGGTLGVGADFTASSGVAQSAFINLSGQNTFTGPLSVANTRGLTSGAYLTIGGERINNTTGVTPGSGSLGTTSLGTGNYTNTISLASGTILNYASSANQTLGGVISGNGSLLKQGAGTLTLTAGNTYSGTMTAGGGVLKLDHATALPGGIGVSGGTSGLTISGSGVVGLTANSGDFARPVGTTVSDVQWTGSGGFAAFGGTRSVALSASSINWSATSFIGSSRTLILGHATADATLDWQQAISLAEAARTVQVDDGSAAVDAIMSRNIAGGTTGTANNFTKTGTGTLAFTSDGNSYWGPTTINAGTITVGNGGTTGRLSVNSASTVVASGAKLAVNHSDDVSQVASGGLGNGTAIISGAGGFAQIGTGTTTLTLANAYTGATTISAGTLLVNNTIGSGTGGGNVSVTAGTLGGNGGITGSVTIGDGTGSADAILAPGNSIDSIDTGNLAFNSDGSYAVELNGTSVTSDVTNVTGTVTINAATTLTVSLAGTLSASQQYVIVSNDAADAVNGTFAGLVQDAVIGNFGGTDLKISYTGGDGNDIVLYTAASGTPYSTWAGSAVFTDDANGDGVKNGLAWILGASAPGVNALDKLPVVATPTGFLTLDFDRINPSSPAKLYVEYGNDLVGWTKVEIPAASGTFGGDLEVVVTSGTPDQLLVKIPTTHASGGKLFARLSATEN